MSVAGGPKLAGIGPGAASDLVVCLDAHDAGSYPGEPTVNEVFDTRTSLFKGWGSSYMLDSFPIPPTVAHSRTNVFPAPVPVPGKIEFGTYWEKSWWWGDINLGATRTFSAGDTITFSGWYLPWTSDLPAIIAANRGLYDNRLGLHLYGTTYLGIALLLSPIANGVQLVNGFNNWWYFESTVTIPAGGSSNVRIEDRGWDYYFNNSGTSGGAEVFNVEYYWCNVQIEVKPYRTPLVRKTGRGVAAGEVSCGQVRPASVDLYVNDSFSDKSPNKLPVTNGWSGVTMPGFGGKFGGNALYFNGNSYLQYTMTNDWGNGALFGAANYTIEFWHYMPAGTSLNNHASWISTYTSGLTKGIIIAQYAGSGTYGVWTDGTGWLNTGVTILTDQWAHVAVVRHGTGTNECSYYLNGTAIMSFTDVRTYDYTYIREFTVGALYDASSAHALEGYMSDVRVCSGTALYSRNFTPPTSPELSAPVVDLSGSDNGGNFATTAMTDVRTYNKGQVIEPVANAVWDFDGTDDLIDLGNINYNGLPGLTVATWVYSSNFAANDTFMSSWGDDAYSNYAWLLFMSTWTAGKIDWLVSSGGTSYTRCQGATRLTDALWYYVVGTWNPSGAMILYVNAVQDGAATGPTSIKDNDFNTFIGCDSDGGSESKVRFFGGQMGNAAIWKTTLSAAQVKQNFNSQRSRFGV